MAVRCWRRNCKFNKGGWCELTYWEIDEDGVCTEFEPKPNDVIMVREVPYKEAKRMVMNYIAKKIGEVIWSDEIADKLRLPYEQVHMIILDLINEGKIEIVRSEMK